LEKAGYDNVPVISINLSGLEENPGFKLSLPLIQRGLYSLIFGDIFMRCLYRTRPYEAVPGSANALHEKWKAKSETPYRNNTVFQQGRRLSAIEDYDARKEEQGWLLGDFDDSKWNTACLSPINDDNWNMKLQTIPEGKVHEMITPTCTGVQTKGVQVFDAGKIVTGWPRLELPCFSGKTIRMRYSEDLDGEGRVKHNV
jgi:hypothetical protein